MQEILTESLQTVPGLELAGVAETATEALAAFESHRPDVVILDLALRVGSGLDVLHEIKQRAPACRVLVFTGYDEEPFRTRCLAEGADYFFSKNRQHRELIQELHNLGGDAPAATGRPTRVPPTPQTLRIYEGHMTTLTTASRIRRSPRLMSEKSNFTLQWYYDRTHRRIPGTFAEDLDIS